MKKEIASLKQRMTGIMGSAAELCGQLEHDKQPAAAMVTTQFEAAYKSLLILEGILIPASELKKAPTRKKYGKYGWVKLRDDEYANLLKEFGEKELQRCITYIDESALTIPDSKPDINTDNIPPLPPKGNEFDLFWKAYPKKKAKADAEKAWNSKAVEGDKHIDAILSALKEQRQSADWQKEDGKFIPHPATWLRGRRWEDSEPEQAPPPEPPPPPEINWGGDSIEDRLGVSF